MRHFGDRYTVAYLHARNGGMLAGSTAVVAVWRPSKTGGGTAGAVAKATRLRRPGVRIDPDARTVTWPPETEETDSHEQETLPL